MERHLGFFSSVYVVLSASLFLFRQQVWQQEVLASYWWVFLIIAPGVLFSLIRKLVSRRAVTAGVFLVFASLVTHDLFTTALLFSMPVFGMQEPNGPAEALSSFTFSYDMPGGSIISFSDCHIRDTIGKRLRHTAFDEKSCAGIASDYPIVGPRFEAYGDDLAPIFESRIGLPAGSVRLVMINFGTGSSKGWLDQRLALRRVSTEMRHSKERWLMIGDFSSGAEGRTYRGFLDAARAADASWGRGLLPIIKYPSLPFGETTIHALYKGGLRVTRTVRSGRGLLLSLDLLPDLVELGERVIP